MNFARELCESMGLNYELIMSLIIVVVLAALIVLIVLKLFKIAIGLVFLLVAIPMMFNLFFGDGSALVEKVANFLPPDTAQQLEESYDYFKEKEAQDQLIDSDKIEQSAKQRASDYVRGVLDPVTGVDAPHE